MHVKAEVADFLWIVVSFVCSPGFLWRNKNETALCRLPTIPVFTFSQLNEHLFGRNYSALGEYEKDMKKVSVMLF